MGKVVSLKDLQIAVEEYVRSVSSPPNSNQFEPVPTDTLNEISERMVAESTQAIQQTGGTVME